MAAISAAAVVGWVVAPIINTMLNKVESYLKGQIKFCSKINSDLMKLKNRLDEISLALSVVKRPSQLDGTQASMLKKLRGQVDDAGEILDMFDYLVLKQQVPSKKVIKRFASSSKSFCKQLLGLDAMKSKLKDVLQAVESVAESAKLFVKVMDSNSSRDSYIDQELQQFQTTVSCRPELTGRQKEISDLIGMLLNEKLSTIKPLVISIIGNAGIGKTALAQVVFHDGRTVSQFDTRIWISLSGNLDELKYTKEMLRYVDKELNMDDMNLNLVQENLLQRLTGKRVLLVLDDVWNAEVLTDYMNSQRWRKFLEPLRHANAHVVILVTTRMKLVADLLNSDDVCELGSLPYEDSVALFESCAFGNVNPESYPELRELGNFIVVRLSGVPLAINVVGSLLSGQLRYEAWEEVLNMDLSMEQSIMSVLRLSYDRLPLHLQRCFAHCSVFPKNFLLTPELLVNHWIAQGYVVASDQNGLVTTAFTYFEELLSRSFFQPIVIDSCGHHVYYMMHNQMTDLAQYVSMGQFLRVEGHICPQIGHDVRHLYITQAALAQLKDEHLLRRLKTLIVVPAPNQEAGLKATHLENPCLKAALKHLRSVRFLHVHCQPPGTVLPDVFGKFAHLRCLSMHNMSEQVPPSVAKLYHLQMIRISHRTSSEAITFPKGIKNLSNILNISVLGCPINLKGGRHPAMQGSMGYRLRESFRSHFEIVCKTRPNENWTVDWIKDMNKLEGLLGIVIPKNIASVDDASKLQLDRKREVVSLFVQWLPSNKELNSEDMLAALRPSYGLERLVINGYTGLVFPSWLSTRLFEKLSVISLVDCAECEVMPCFGDLPSLVSLIIKGMPVLKKIGPEFFGTKGFPSLVRFELYGVPELEEIRCPDDIEETLPNAVSFEVHDCVRLTKVPFWQKFRWQCTAYSLSASWVMEPFTNQNLGYDEVGVVPLDFDAEYLGNIMNSNKCIVNDKLNIASNNWGPMRDNGHLGNSALSNNDVQYRDPGTSALFNDVQCRGWAIGMQ
ncbi:hypothetical protein ACP4OV_023331 [Aristida adscensionis]